ncbi:MAG: hypothetical protein AAF635_01580 [Cyanobacteria bacterium P01_C01_bin.69]
MGVSQGIFLMYDLTQLTLQDVTEMGAHLRGLGKDADSLETVAARCVQYLRAQLVDVPSGESACVLARFFKTHAYGRLPGDLQSSACNLMQTNTVADDVKCLTLMATAGEKRDWCDRTASKGHQAIPLISEKAVEGIPMISQLIRSFGLDISCVVAPDDALLVELERKTCNVFYIQNALGSEYIPAQSDFVAPFGIKSVIGFGGMLPAGDLFAVILFTKVVIDEDTARLLKTLPLNIKMAMMPLLRKNTFRDLQLA